MPRPGRIQTSRLHPEDAGTVGWMRYSLTAEGGWFHGR